MEPLENRRDTEQAHKSVWAKGWSFWRRYCLCGTQTADGAPTTIELNERSEQTRDSSEQVRPLSSPAALRWQGSSYETFKSLIGRVAKLKIENYQNIDKLKRDIYNFYSINKRQQGFSDNIDQNQYIQSLNLATWQKEAPEDRDVQKVHGYFGLGMKASEKASVNFTRQGRFILNIQPDKIAEVTTDILQKIAPLPYVYNIKVAATTQNASEWLDNFIVYFHDTAQSVNRSQLQKRLSPYAEYTRTSHPAMMDPISKEIQGIVFADESKGGSWGDGRAKAIAEAAWSFKQSGEKMSYKPLLQKVKQVFKTYRFDPENPHLNIYDPIES